MKFIIILCLIEGISIVTLYSQSFTAHYDHYSGNDGSDRGVTVTAEEDGLTIVSASLCNNYNSGCSWVIKTDLQGNELWKVVFENFPYSISLGWNDKLVKMESGSYVASGWIFNPDTGYQGFLLNFDSLGSILWQKEYGQNDLFEVISDFKQLPDGGFLVYLEEGFLNSPFDYHKKIIKTNPLGKIIWQKDLNNHLFKRETKGNFDVLPNGDIWITYNYHENPNSSPDKGSWFVLTDSMGNIKWEKQMTPAPFDCVERVGHLPNGNLVLSYCVYNFPLGLQIDQALEVIDTNGNFIWRHEFRSFNAWPFTNNIKIAANGDIIGCGYGFNDDQLETAWLFRISSDGVLLWERKFLLDGHLNDAPSFIDLDELPDGRIAAVSHIVDSTETGLFDGNVWLVVVDSAGCLTPGCEPEQVDVLVDLKSPPQTALSLVRERFFNAGPNPASGWLTIDFRTFPRNEGWLELFSPDGRLVRRTVIRRGDAEIKWDTADFPPGFYLLRLQSGGQTLQTEKIILHR